jgi:polyferredoxin
VVLMGGTALLAVAVGPLYCANLCPFGAAQELLALLGMGVRPSRHLERKTRYVRYVVLALLVGAWMLTGSRSVISADPLVHVFSGKLSGVMLTLVVAVALISVFSFRFWCRTFCPVGALLSLGGRVAVALRLVPDKRYGLCDLGARTDRDGECLHCNRCLTGSTLTAARMKARRWAFGARNIDRWTRLAVAGVGIVFAAAVLSPSPPLPGAEDSSSGRPRDVRVDRIRELIQEDRLSDHEALYWHPLEEQEPPADGPPPSGDGGTDPSH